MLSRMGGIVGIYLMKLQIQVGIEYMLQLMSHFQCKFDSFEGNWQCKSHSINLILGGKLCKLCSM